MTEAIPNPYWTEDVLLGETTIAQEHALVRLKLHTGEEPYRGHGAAELLPLSSPTGVAISLHGQPYLLEPALSLDVALSPSVHPSGAIGEIAATHWVGMRHRPVGNAQAWYYPADHLLLLWECFLEDRDRHESPFTDPLLQTVWTGVEALLCARFPAAARIVTPSWEDLYEKVAWQQFLGAQGYEATSLRAFVKHLPPEIAHR